MATPERRIVVVRRIKKSHGGHHGGSWKVAYADFVTAMMAFFMVLWIMGLDDSVRASIEEYFSARPVGITRGYSAGTNPLAQGSIAPSLRLIGRDTQREQFREIAERLRTELDKAGFNALDASIEIVLTEEGLRIELVEGKGGETFFRVGSATLMPAAQKALGLIAAELRPLAHAVVLEGHTDAAQYGSKRYTNFELSADRANAARRTLEAGGLWPRNVVEIRGYADRFPRVPDNPLDPSNRRISILLPYTESRAAEVVTAKAGTLSEARTPAPDSL